MNARHVHRRFIGAAALLLIVGAISWIKSSSDTVHVTAYFPTTVGVYEGSEVRLMGVPIGTVTKIEPEGTTVRVELEYDAEYDLPSDASALIVSPSVVADRFVQLAPAYDGSGPKLADRAVIPQEKTRVPVELDEIFQTTHDLLRDLGPEGVNDGGAINRLLAVAANNLRGQGDPLRQTIANLSAATSTLGDSSSDLFAGIGHLERFTDQLVTSDAEVRTFNQQMANVSAFLAGERDELSAALRNLASTFGLVERFVRDNRDLLATNVDHLGRITDALVAERAALVGIMRVLPVAASNMARSYDNVNQSIRARANETQLAKNIGGLLCDALERQGIPRPTQACAQLTEILKTAGLL